MVKQEQNRQGRRCSHSSQEWPNQQCSPSRQPRGPRLRNHMGRNQIRTTKQFVGIYYGPQENTPIEETEREYSQLATQIHALKNLLKKQGGVIRVMRVNGSLQCQSWNKHQPRQTNQIKKWQTTRKTHRRHKTHPHQHPGKDMQVDETEPQKPNGEISNRLHTRLKGVWKKHWRNHCRWDGHIQNKGQSR